MRFKKKAVVSVLLVVVLGTIVALTWWLMASIEKAWNDENTWTSEQKVILPKETSALKVKNVLSEGAASTEKLFDFRADYCYLYQIEEAADGESATLRCSLLPMYYAERQQEVPKDWQEKSDILLKISKNDVEPTVFLDRNDKSFRSVSTIGEDKYPVSIQATGKYTYPAASVTNKIAHYFKTVKGSKETIDAVINSYSVSRLDTINAKDRTKYAETWAKDMAVALKQKIDNSGLMNLTGQPFLNKARATFKDQSIECSKLSECNDKYESNPSDAFAYALFAAEKIYPEYFNHTIEQLYSHMYPLAANVDLPVGEEQETDDWMVFTVYETPLCPINDITSPQEPSRSARFVDNYLRKESILTIDRERENVSEFLSWLKTLKTADVLRAEQKQYASWQPETIFSVMESCNYAVYHKNESPELNKEITDAYFLMLSLITGSTLDGTRESMEKLIYESTAYSPYKNLYMSDDSVANFREDQDLQLSPISAASYAEWKSVIVTYIMLYLYGRYI